MPTGLQASAPRRAQQLRDTSVCAKILHATPVAEAQSALPTAAFPTAARQPLCCPTAALPVVRRYVSRATGNQSATGCPRLASTEASSTPMTLHSTAPGASPTNPTRRERAPALGVSKIRARTHRQVLEHVGKRTMSRDDLRALQAQSMIREHDVGGVRHLPSASLETRQ
jgi:hypothetical protein